MSNREDTSSPSSMRKDTPSPSFRAGVHAKFSHSMKKDSQKKSKTTATELGITGNRRSSLSATTVNRRESMASHHLNPAKNAPELKGHRIVSKRFSVPDLNATFPGRRTSVQTEHFNQVVELSTSMTSSTDRWKSLMNFVQTNDVKTKKEVSAEDGEAGLFGHEDCDERHANFRKEGDFTLYSSIKAAQREALKRNPRLHAAVGMFWHTYASVKDGEEGLDDDSRGISCDEHLAVNVKFSKALFHAAEFDRDSAKMTALEDWKREMGGKDAMKMVEFYDSMFELVGKQDHIPYIRFVVIVLIVRYMDARYRPRSVHRILQVRR